MDKLKVKVKAKLEDSAGYISESDGGTFLDSGLDLVLSMLAQESGKTGISVGAIGTGTPTTLALGNEVGRKALAGVSNTTDGKIFTIFYPADYPTTEYTIAEVALLGDGATETTGTGTTIATTSISPSILKSPGTHTLTIDYRLYKA